jgi:hypothetical protein
LKTVPPRQRAGRSARFIRPRIEALEDRTLPSSFTPIQIRHAYGFDRAAFEDASHPQVAADGTGQTIAIVDAFDDPNIAHDLATFDSTYGLAAPPSFTKVNQTGGTTYPPPNRGWATEIALDVEYAHAMAPGANILLVEATSNSFGNLNTAVQYAANHGAIAVSMSYGAGEFSGETSYDSVFTHSGVTYLSSTGDSGAPGGYQAFSPNVVAVGGTSLTLDSSGNYSSESGWSGSGGGISQYESQPPYQSGVVTQSSTRRCTPDISFVADPNTGVRIYDTYGGSGFFTVGGTSASCPIMAGLTAIVDQGNSYLFGQSSYTGTDLLTALYRLPQSDIADILTGNNGFAAGAGYDLVTGRGTPIVDRFVSAMDGTPVFNPVDGSLLVTGGAHGSTDTITLSQSGGQLEVQISAGTPLPGIPSNQTFFYNSGQFSSVTISTGDGSTTVNVQDTTPVTVNLAVHGNTTVNVGADHNTVNLWETDSGTSTTINGSSTMTVNVGRNGSVQKIKGSVILDNPTSFTTVNVDDSADTTSRTVTVGVTSFGGATYEYVSGLAPATIYAELGQTNSLTVRTGRGGASVSVQGTDVLTSLIGNASGTNTLVGVNVDTTWNITGTNAGNFRNANATASFTNFQNLTGGSGNDTFVFSNGAGVSGNINGGGGTNMLNYAAYNTGVTVDLSANSATGVGGSVTNIQQLRGGAGNDSLTGNTSGTTTFFASPGIDIITGAGGTNTLLGTNLASTWSITAQNAGTLTFGGGTTTFSGVQNLTGGSGNDTFVFANGAGVDGNIDGGSGSNTFNYAAYSSGVTVDLSANTATGVGGTFANIQTFVGAGAGGNALHGPNADTTWNITAQNAGALTGGFSFSAFQNLTGGSGADTFVFADGAGVDGNIDGGGGTNSLNYAAYTANIIVDLQTSAATGVLGTVANIQNVKGADSAGGYNLLIGNSGNVLTGGTGRRNILVAGGTASTLVGGNLDDLLIGGTTSYDTEAGLVSWQAIATYWAGSDSYSTRVNNLATANGVPLLDATIVTGNGGSNTMSGSGALAYIFTDLTDTISGFNAGSQTVTVSP